jgi:hypothetical protein
MGHPPDCNIGWEAMKNKVALLNAVALALGIVIFAPTASAAPGQANTIPERANKTNPDRGSIKAPAGNILLSASSQKPLSADNPSTDFNGNSPNEQKRLWFDRRMAVGTERLADETNALATFTFWLACLTGALAAIGFLQFIMFYKQLGIMKQTLIDAEGAAKTAKVAADALRETVQTMKDTAQRRLRAYVSVRGTVPPPRDGIAVAWFKVENTGDTPAFNMIDLRDAWIDTYPKPVQQRPKPTDGKYQLSPRDDITLLTDEIDVSEEELQAIRDENKAIWCSVDITYEDTFGNRWNTNVLGYMTGERIDSSDDRRIHIETYTAT